MIELKLDVDDFCHKCPEFDPQIENSKMYADNEVINIVTVTCPNRKHCRAVADMTWQHFKEVHNEKKS